MDLSQKDWKTKLENDPNAVILDVRTEEIWKEDFLNGKAMLPFEMKIKLVK